MLGIACFIISLIHMFKRVLCKQKLTGIAFLDVLCCKVQASQFKDVLPGIETRRPVRSQLFCSCATSSFPLSHGCKAGCCDSARACPRPWPSAWFLWHWQTPFHLKKHPNCCYIAWKYQTILQMLSVLISKTCSALHVDSVLEMILSKSKFLALRRITRDSSRCSWSPTTNQTIWVPFQEAESRRMSKAQFVGQVGWPAFFAICE